MSEARLHPRAVEAENETPALEPGATVASHFADAAKTFVKIVAPFTVPVVGRYADRIGTLFTEADWRILNAARLSRAAAQGRAAISTGKQANKSDAEKQAWLIDHVNKFELDPEDTGTEFERSLLETAVDRVFFGLAKAQGGYTGDYKDNDSAAHRLARKPMVDAIMSDPARAERYIPLVEAEMAVILNERHAVTVRTAKAKADLSNLNY